MRCPSCGIELPDDAQACPACGPFTPGDAPEAPVDGESVEKTLAKGGPQPEDLSQPEEAAQPEDVPQASETVELGKAAASGAAPTKMLGSDYKTAVKPGPMSAAEPADPDKDLRMDIDPVSSSGAIDALDSLYDTGGMQFPIEGMAAGKKAAAEGSGFFARHRKAIIAIVVVLVAAAVAAALVFSGIFSRTARVSDSVVRGSLEGDQPFMTGSASTQFVGEDPYQIQRLDIKSREAQGDGVVVEATVEIKNAFFDETRDVTIAYPNLDDLAAYTITVNTHNIVAIRGIAVDPEYGVTDANPTFDQTAQTCHLSYTYDDDASRHWYYTESGTVELSYEFSNDTWKRTAADTDGVTTNFQRVVGAYGQVQDFDPSRSPGFVEFVISSADNTTGAIDGTFTWARGESGWFGYSVVDGSFKGYVHKDGTIETAASGSANTITFSGKLGEDGAMTISGTVYYDNALSTFGMDEASKDAFSDVELSKAAAGTTGQEVPESQPAQGGTHGGPGGWDDDDYFDLGF